MTSAFFIRRFNCPCSIVNENPLMLEIRPTISVILPIYNKIEIVYDCILQNAKHASQQNNWILIDNGSDENTKLGIKRLTQELSRLGQLAHVITEPANTGVARAWNKGIANSRTEYCLILNNDCVLQKQWDQRLLDFHGENRSCIVSALIFEPGDYPPVHDLNSFLLRQTKLAERNMGRFRAGLFVGITLFSRTSTFREVGAFDEQYWLSMEETDFLVRAMNQNITVGITGNVVGFHFSSVTRKSVNFDHDANLRHFAQKHHWDYRNWQAASINKFIRSWQKRILYWTGRLSKMSERPR